MTITKFCKILKDNVPNLIVSNDKSFKDLTTFKIGGKIKCFVEINDTNTLLKVLALINKYNMPYFILGFGSNILCSDKPCNKVVLKINIKYLKTNKNTIVCGAGVGLFNLNHFAIKNGLSGLEWSYGIPGSVGGAIKMNAGSFDGEMSQVVKSVFYTDGQKIYKKENKALNFGYRQSFFKNNNFVILKVVFSLQKSEKDFVEKKCFTYYEKRRKTQPYNLPSAGSVFKRPQNSFAPVLIESCGLKGLSCGGAEISSKHCGFIVNSKNNATFNQVIKLINKIKKTVLKKFDIILEEEIIILK